MRLDQLRTRRDEVLALAERHGACNVRVFGSTARGEAGPERDVDLLVDVGAHPSPFFPGGLLVDMEVLLACRVDIVTEKSLHWYIRADVLREALSL